MAHLASATSNPGLTAGRGDQSGPVEICTGAQGPLLRLHVLGARICVEQRMVSAPRRELACYAVFDDEAQFLQWCDADEAWLSYPLVHRRLRQVGCDLLAKHRGLARDAQATDER